MAQFTVQDVLTAGSALRCDEWNEADHPRDENGRFGEGPGGNAGEHAGVLGIVRELTSAGRKAAFERSGLGVYGKDHPIIQNLAKAGHLKISSSGAISAASHVKDMLKTVSRSDIPENIRVELNPSLHYGPSKS